MTKTRDEKIELIREIANDIGGDVRDGYSGRGMYGETCYGIDCDDADDVIEQAALKGLPRPSVDRMGKGYIAYWPSIKGED